MSMRDYGKDVVPGQQVASFFRRLGIVKPNGRNPRFLGDGWTSKGWRLLDSFAADITPKEALELYQNHRHPDNRQLNEIHVNNLTRDIESGVNIALVFVGDNLVSVIVNGHHTLVSIGLQTKTLRASFSIYEAKDVDAMSALYAIFDDNYRRTYSQVVKASSFEYTAPQTWVTKCTTAIRMAQEEFPGAKKSKGNMDFLNVSQQDDALAFTQLLHEIARKYQSSRNSRTLPTAVVASMYCMWLSERDFAADFIESYVSGANLDADSPIFVLRELVSDRKEGSHASNLVSRHAAWAHMAWIAYLNGKKVTARQFRKRFTDGYDEMPSFDNWIPRSADAA